MSKKKKNTFKKILSILACVALLAITIIPVNNIYAEDNGNTTNNTDQTQEVENNNEGNTNTENTSNDSSNQLQETFSDNSNGDNTTNTTSTEETPISNQENQESTQEGNTSTNKPIFKSPVRNGGPTITASIVDDNGDTIDFSSGTSGSQEIAYFQDITSSTDLTSYCPISLSFSGLSSTSFEKRVEISIPYDMIVQMQSAIPDNQLTQSLDTSKGNNQGYELIRDAISNYTTSGTQFQGKIIYYISDDVTGLSINNLQLTYAGIQRGTPDTYINDAIVVSLYENNSKVSETKLDKGMLSRVRADVVTPANKTSQAIIGGTGQFKFSWESAQNVSNLVSSLEITFKVSDPRVTLDFSQCLNTLGSYFEIDNSQQAQGIYVLKLKDSVDFFMLYGSSESNLFFTYKLPDNNLSIGDEIEIDVDTKLGYYQHSMPNHEKAYELTYKDIIKVIEETYSITVRNDTRNVTSKPQNNVDYLVDRLTYTNNGIDISSEGIFELTFNTDKYGIRGFLYNPRHTDAAGTPSNNGEHTYILTTTQRTTPFPVTINVVKARRGTGTDANTRWIYIDGKADLGLNDDEYITSIKTDVLPLPRTYNNIIMLTGRILDLTKEYERSFKYYSIDQQGNEKVYVERTDIINHSHQAQIYSSRVYDETNSSVRNPIINAGEKQGLIFALDAVYWNEPVIYIAINTKDGSGNYLRLENFKIASSRDTWAYINPDDIRTYETSVGRVYEIDTHKIGLRTGNYYDLTQRVVYGTFAYSGNNYDNATLELRPEVRIGAELVVPLGTPYQTQEVETLFFFEDQYEKTVTNYTGAYNNQFYIYDNLPNEISVAANRNTDNSRYANASGIYSQPAYTISSFKTIDVASSAKHHDADTYQTWNVGDEPIAVGNKSSFDIKVDVVNSAEEAITGDTVVYIPIPKKGETGWGSLLQDDEGNTLDGINFSTKLNSVTPNVPIGTTYKIEYGAITPADNNADLEAQSGSFSETFNASLDYNCVKITITDIPANAAGVPDLYSFVLNCSTKDVTQEGDINTYRPLFKRDLGGSVSWPKGSLLSLETALGEVRGQLFVDDDMNGKFDASETALSQSGVALTLYDANGIEIAKTTTDNNGEYLFVDIKTKDEYYIVAENPDASLYTFTTLGTANIKNRYYSDNQFDENGRSNTVYPAIAGTNGLTSATYNIGLMDANAVTTFTFDANGGQFTDVTTVETTKEVTGKNNDRVVVPTPSRTGYKFAGWDKEIPSTFGYEDKTFLAKWEAKKFTVNYDTDGGSRLDPKTVTWDSTDLLSSTIPTKPGYMLDGWLIATGAIYDGEPYSELAGSETTESITLKANWKAKTYTVEYVDDDGRTLTEKDFKFDDDKLTDEVNTTVKKKGFNLIGWLIDLLTGKKYESDMTYSDVVGGKEDKTRAKLYAEWEANQYYVYYNDNKGENVDVGGDNPKLVTFVTTNLTPLNNPEKTGYVFKSWFKDQNCTQGYNNEAYSVLAGDDELTQNTTLYAKFDPITFTVEFDSNGGQGYMAPKEVTYGDQTADGKAPDVLFTKDGYKPDGWNSAPDGSGTPYAAGSDISTLADKDGKTVKLYTQWKATEYTISYDLDGGSVQGSNPVVYTIESDDITLINPTKNGYTFTGWTGTDLTDKTMSVVIPKGSMGNREYKANWEAVVYTITYDLDGGELEAGKTNPETYTIESDDITLNNPSKTGYNFKGWTGTDLTDKTMSVVISKGSTGNREYTATYEAIKYTISFSNEGSTSGVAPADVAAEYDKPVPAPDQGTLVSDGKDFDGWLDPNTNEVYKPGDEIKNLTTTEGATVTLVPVWESFTYDVIDGNNQPWTKGSSANASFEFRRSRLDKEPEKAPTTYQRFIDNGKKVYLDGSTLIDSSNYTISEGSLKLSLVPSYLEGLGNGSHTITVEFGDGEATATFKINPKPQVISGGGSTKVYYIPKTGVDAMPHGLNTSLVSLALLGVVAIVAKKKTK